MLKQCSTSFFNELFLVPMKVLANFFASSSVGKRIDGVEVGDGVEGDAEEGGQAPARPVMRVLVDPLDVAFEVEGELLDT
jgi:hypothetical protein